MQQWFDDAPANPECGKQAVVARFDGMASRFALVAWGRALLLDEFNLDAARTFAQQWTDHAAAPEPGAC